MRAGSVGTLIRQLRCPHLGLQHHAALPPQTQRVVAIADNGPLFVRRFRRNTFQALSSASSDNYCTSDMYRAVDERLGRLSSAPSIPALEPLKVVVSGPSGVGKDAVIKALQAARPDLHFVVTATSRPKRPGEVDGVDYIFVSKQQFEDWIDSKELLEWALVYGDYKGIPQSRVMEALKRGTDVVFRLDIQGAQTMRRKFPDAVTIFIVAETEEALVRRLIDRKTEPLDKMLTRVQTAREEMKHIGEFDYVVLNKDGDLAGAVQQINAIITAERHRSDRLRWQDDGGGSADGAMSQPAAGQTAATGLLPEMQKC